MRTFLTTLAALILVSLTPPSLAAQCNCGLQKYTPSSQPASFVFDVANESSDQNIPLITLNQALDNARNDWNAQFSARGMSGVSVSQGGYAASNGIRVTIVDS